MTHLESHIFTKEDSVQEADNCLLDEMVIQTKDEEDEYCQIRARFKRSHNIASLGEDEEQRLEKRARTPPVTGSETSSGGKASSPRSAPTWEITVKRTPRKQRTATPNTLRMV